MKTNHHEPKIAYDAKLVWRNILWNELLGENSPSSKHKARVEYNRRKARQTGAKKFHDELRRLALLEAQKPHLNRDIAKLEYRSLLETKYSELEKLGISEIGVLTMLHL